jgi:tetratricopeptide (TPR) repeat protein
MKKLLYLVIALFFYLPTAFSIFGTPPDLSAIKREAPRKIELKANNYFRTGDYNNAYYYYLALSQVRGKINTAQTYRFGKSALVAGDYTTAVTCLGQVRQSGRKNKLVAFEYANALKYAGDYSKAITAYQEYIAAHQAESQNQYIAFSKEHIISCEKAIRDQKVQALASENGQVVETKAQIRAITSTSRHGYRLAEYQDQSGTMIVRLNNQLQIEPTESSISNPAFRSSSPCIAPDGETVYFTRPERNAQGTQEFKIFMGKLDADGNVLDIQKLSSGVNRIGYSSLHPTIAIVDGNEYLYFTSTIPGGNGGFDIWYAMRIKNNEFTQAYHTGMRVNSPQDEITPHYYQPAQELYFSSNRAEGMGGFDVYRLTGTHMAWQEEEAFHLPAPINSEGDDYYYRQDAGSNQTYLTTNRLDGKTDQTVQFRQLMRAELTSKILDHIDEGQ